MIHSYKETALDSLFGMSTHAQDEIQYFESQGLITILWNRGDEPVSFLKDNMAVILLKNQITTTTYLQKIEFNKKTGPLTAFTFNRPFYCIQDHDDEVSCNGIIFFGNQVPPIISISEDEARKFEALLEVFIDEFSTRDRIQGEMLRMLLKRLIIKITRIAKQQHLPSEFKESQIDMVRKYNVLVDMHFKEKRQVNEYAEMLFKSPKTLSNLFSKFNQKTPLQIIHERIVLEAKRLLMYSDKNIKEIAFELGFDDTGSFHKLFKKITGDTPQNFKKSF